MCRVELSLPPDLEAFVDAKIASGQYSSRAEMLQAALVFLRDEDRAREAKLDELRRDIQIGLDELQQGLGTPLNMDEIRAEVSRRVSQSS